MLRDLPRMRAVIEAVKQAVTVPVTVKTRLGWNANSIVADQVAVLCQSLGVAALALHARTRSQFFSGEADYSCARTIKACAALPLWLNGGLQDVKHISKIVKESGAEGKWCRWSTYWPSSLAKQPWVAHGFLRKSNTFFSQGNVYTCHLTRFTTQYKPIYRVFIVSTVAI